MNVDRPTMPLVLMYHSVAPFEQDPFHVTVTPQRFERQLEWLHARKLRGTSMRELLDAWRTGSTRGLVGLTFDDGYEDFATWVIPALAHHGFTATAFVVAGSLGRHNSWDQPGPQKALMTTLEVRQAAAVGIEIGSHGLRHISLPDLGDQTLTDEIASSRTALENTTEGQVGGFCYPYGDVTSRVADAVRAAGYDYACAVRPNGIAGAYALPRTYVGNRDRYARLDAKRMRHEITETLRTATNRRESPEGTNTHPERMREP